MAVKIEQLGTHWVLDDDNLDEKHNCSLFNDWVRVKSTNNPRCCIPVGDCSNERERGSLVKNYGQESNKNDGRLRIDPLSLWQMICIWCMYLYDLCMMYVYVYWMYYICITCRLHTCMDYNKHEILIFKVECGKPSLNHGIHNGMLALLYLNYNNHSSSICSSPHNYPINFSHPRPAHYIANVPILAHRSNNSDPTSLLHSPSRISFSINSKLSIHNAPLSILSQSCQH